MEKEILTGIFVLMSLLIFLTFGLFIALYTFDLYKPTSLILYYLRDVTAAGNYFVETCLMWFYNFLHVCFLLIMNHRTFPFKRPIYSNLILMSNIIFTMVFYFTPIADTFFQDYRFKAEVISLFRTPNLVHPVLAGYLLYLAASYTSIFLVVTNLDNYYLKKDLEGILAKDKKIEKEKVNLIPS